MKEVVTLAWRSTKKKTRFSLTAHRVKFRFVCRLPEVLCSLRSQHVRLSSEGYNTVSELCYVFVFIEHFELWHIRDSDGLRLRIVQPLPNVFTLSVSLDLQRFACGHMVQKLKYELWYTSNSKGRNSGESPPCIWSLLHVLFFFPLFSTLLLFVSPEQRGQLLMPDKRLAFGTARDGRQGAKRN